MKTPLTPLTELYLRWANSLSVLTGKPLPSSELPPKAELTPRAVQAAANEEWDNEGGTCKPAATPVALKSVTEQAPKLPL
jgi:hypothetical protein